MKDVEKFDKFEEMKKSEKNKNKISENNQEIHAGELFFGHFTDAVNGVLVLDQKPAPNKLLIELIAWDQQKKFYNFYELIGTATGGLTAGGVAEPAGRFVGAFGRESRRLRRPRTICVSGCVPGNKFSDATTDWMLVRRLSESLRSRCLSTRSAKRCVHSPATDRSSKKASSFWVLVIL